MKRKSFPDSRRAFSLTAEAQDMFKVKVITGKKGSKAVSEQEFLLDAANETSYRQVMRALSDCLYDTDLDFDVDEDGDMVIDDILLNVSEETPFEETLEGKKVRLTVVGTSV
jgi:hypothetical protein